MVTRIPRFPFTPLGCIVENDLDIRVFSAVFSFFSFFFNLALFFCYALFPRAYFFIRYMHTCVYIHFFVLLACFPFFLFSFFLFFFPPLFFMLFPLPKQRVGRYTRSRHVKRGEITKFHGSVNIFRRELLFFFLSHYFSSRVHVRTAWFHAFIFNWTDSIRWKSDLGCFTEIFIHFPCLVD